MNERLRWVAAALVVSSSACLLPVSTENSPCPCSAGFECCASTQTCSLAGSCGVGGGSGGGAGGGGVGGGTVAGGVLQQLTVRSDGELPITAVLPALAPPAKLAMVGETAYVTGRITEQCKGTTTTLSPFALHRLEIVDGAWSLIWRVTLPVQSNASLSMVASDAGVIVFGSGELDGEAARGGNEGFVMRVRHDGSIAWKRQFASLLEDSVSAVLERSSGKLVVAGTTGGSLHGSVAQGALDVFVAWLAEDGSIERFEQCGSGDSDVASTLIGLDAETFVLTGVTNGRLEAGATQTPGALFLRKYDGAGAVLWTRQLEISAEATVTPWGHGFAATDTSRGSFFARISGSGSLEWISRATPREPYGIGQLRVLDADRASVQGLHTLPELGPIVYPSRLPFESIWSADGGVTEVPSFGPWPREHAGVPWPGLTRSANGGWFVAGAVDTSEAGTYFSLTSFAAASGARATNVDWLFSGPEYVRQPLWSNIATLGLESTPSGAIVSLVRVTLEECARNSSEVGRVALLRAQP